MSLSVDRCIRISRQQSGRNWHWWNQFCRLWIKLAARVLHSWYPGHVPWGDQTENFRLPIWTSRQAKSTGAVNRPHLVRIIVSWYWQALCVSQAQTNSMFGPYAIPHSQKVLGPTSWRFKSVHDVILILIQIKEPVGCGILFLGLPGTQH